MISKTPTFKYKDIDKSENIWKIYQENKHLKSTRGTSLVVQWLRICLPMLGKWVQSLVWEDSTCFGATKSGCHNY